MSSMPEVSRPGHDNGDLLNELTHHVRLRVATTTTIHTRASTSTHPTTTQTRSRSTHRYDEHDSSAASSTSTGEPPEPISKVRGHRPDISIGTLQDATTWDNAVHHGFFIILNLAMGGSLPNAYGGRPTVQTASGRAMMVDYVAVYCKDA